MEQYITEERTTDKISKKTNECKVFETRESKKTKNRSNENLRIRYQLINARTDQIHF